MRARLKYLSHWTEKRFEIFLLTAILKSFAETIIIDKKSETHSTCVALKNPVARKFGLWGCMSGGNYAPSRFWKHGNVNLSKMASKLFYTILQFEGHGIKVAFSLPSEGHGFCLKWWELLEVMSGVWYYSATLYTYIYLYILIYTCIYLYIPVYAEFTKESWLWQVCVFFRTSGLVLYQVLAHRVLEEKNGLIPWCIQS